MTQLSYPSHLVHGEIEDKEYGKEQRASQSSEGHHQEREQSPNGTAQLHYHRRRKLKNVVEDHQ